MAQKPGKTVLDEIVAARLHALEETRLAVPMDQVQQAAEARTERRDFAAAISSRVSSPEEMGVRVIAELKRASPSRGMIRDEFRPRDIASSYAKGGAAALSVLTEGQYFLGSLEYLAEARNTVQIPVLRKDFILDAYQVYESVAAGADALLLIVAALPDADLQRLLALCQQLRIDALVEVHAAEELACALAAGARIIGVNNRNLKTLEVDLATSLMLREKIPAGHITVSESGIKTGRDLQRLAEAGFDAVLIGEHLVAQPDPEQALRELLADGMQSAGRSVPKN